MMAKRTDDTIFQRLQSKLDFETAVAKAYKSGKFLPRQIARTYGVTPRTVQRIAKKHGVARSQAEGSRVAGPLLPKHRVRRPASAKAVAKSKAFHLTGVMRDIVVQLMAELHYDFTTCQQCSGPITGGRFDIHHTKYEGATFFDLQIVCHKCNSAPRNRYLA